MSYDEQAALEERMALLQAISVAEVRLIWGDVEGAKELLREAQEAALARDMRTWEGILRRAGAGSQVPA